MEWAIRMTFMIVGAIILIGIVCGSTKENKLKQETIGDLRNRIVCDYKNVRLGSGSIGGCFGSILCHELHYGGEGNGLHFKRLAKKWNISVSFLGEIIADHCNRLIE